ncbi:hypothetical protein VTN49DRAFT_2416 [Thermomyces lanuginosus]|uniref:uncharacterized protein n=1 Tax=Thermomyces lanuginosus TaxID=5541 RepID=UPI0037420699
MLAPPPFTTVESKLPALWPLLMTELYAARYHNKCLMSPYTERYVLYPTPLRAKFLWEHRHRDFNTLWWRVEVGHLPFKKVVRTWIARRMRQAFRTALYQQGFDAQGRPLPAAEIQGKEIPSRRSGIAGTVAITATDKTKKASDVQIQKEMNAVVEKLVTVARKTLPSGTAASQKLD